MNAAADFAALEAEIRRSILVRAIDALGEAWRSAWSDSSTAARIDRWRVRFSSLPRAVRVRAFALAAASTTGAYLLILGAVPAQVAPAVPRAVWLLVLASALVVAGAADRLAANWDASVVRRLWCVLTRADS
jgi:hypothetical protein